MFDSRTSLKRVEDWLRRHGWWLFPCGIVLNFVALLFSFAAIGTYDPNVLSISLTVLEVFIVVIALGGFWMMRGAAINAARTAAREEVTRLHQEGYFSDPSKRNMLVSNTGPAAQPDLSEAVRVTDETSEGGPHAS